MAGTLALTLFLGSFVIAANAQVADNRIDDRIARASVGTFNAYLFRGAPGFQERKERFIETLQDAQVNRAPDIMCLQEIYRNSDALDILVAAQGYYPYYASFADLEAPADPATPACNPVELLTFGSCVSAQCSNLTGLAVTNCFLTQCMDDYFGLSRSCRYCLGLEDGADEVTDVNTHCVSAVTASEYSDPYGLMILSRYELTDIEAIDYHPGESVLFIRGYITANVEALGEKVLCTHLTPWQVSNGQIDYVGPPQFATPSQEQAEQVKIILDLMEGESRFILLGDFNHGPATPGTTWVFPLHYGLMSARGLTSINALWCGQCTFCSRNPLTNTTEDYILDHIYLPSCRAFSVTRFERLFHTILTPSGFPLSDHYGVRADLIYPSCDVSTPGMEFQPTGDIDFHIDQFCPGQILDDTME